MKQEIRRLLFTGTLEDGGCHRSYTPHSAPEMEWAGRSTLWSYAHPRGRFVPNLEMPPALRLVRHSLLQIVAPICDSRLNPLTASAFAVCEFFSRCGARSLKCSTGRFLLQRNQADDSGVLFALSFVIHSSIYVNVHLFPNISQRSKAEAL